MNLKETGRLLAVAQAIDNRTVGEMNIKVWQQFLADFSYQDCETAITEHYRRTRDFVMPSDVISRVKALRADRLRRAGTLVPPGGLGVREAQQWLQEARRGIAEGRAGGLALEGRM